MTGDGSLPQIPQWNCGRRWKTVHNPLQRKKVLIKRRNHIKKLRDICRNEIEVMLSQYMFQGNPYSMNDTMERRHYVDKQWDIYNGATKQINKLTEELNEL
jgi:hypothetical protein